MYIIFYPVSIKVFIVKWSTHARRAMRPLPQHTLQLSTCGIFWVLQPGVKIPAVDQTKRESDPRFPTYDVNVQPGLGSRAWEGGTALIPASLDYLIPLVNLALGLFLRSPKVKPNDSRWIKCCKQSRTAFFFDSVKVLKSLVWGSSQLQQSKRMEEWLLSRKHPHSLCCSWRASWSWWVQPTIVTESVMACEWAK